MISYDNHCRLWVLTRIYYRYLGQEVDQARYEQAIKKIESTFDVYEGMLSRQKYLAGDVRTPLSSLSVR